MAIAGLSAALPQPGEAHARLDRSVPAAGETLRAPPGELRLVFSEPVIARYTSLVLRSADGTPITMPALAPDPATGNRQFAAAAPRLAPGAYQVEWRTAASDGHVITGTFRFTVLAADAQTTPGARDAARSGAPAAPGDSREHHVDPRSVPPELLPGSTLNVAARFLQLVAVLGLIGAAMFRALLLSGAAFMPTVDFRLRVAVRRFGTAALLLLLIALPLRLWLESAALHGPDRALDTGLLGSLLTQVTWGRAWLAQAAALGLAALGLFTGFTPLFLLAATGLAFTLPFQAHAAALGQFRVLGLAADGLHVLAAGTWIGSLTVLLVAAMPALFRHGLERGGHDTARLLQRFSPLALAAAALLAIAGTVSTLLHFHSPFELATTPYGRALLLKLGIVLLVLATGWYNWKRARPTLPLHSGVRALRRAALLELLFALAALGVTAVLVALPTP